MKRYGAGWLLSICAAVLLVVRGTRLCGASAPSPRNAAINALGVMLPDGYAQLEAANGSFGALSLYAFRSSVADWNDVPSASMAPTILPGDRVSLNGVAYDLRIPFTFVRLGAPWASPQRGDLVVFFSPDHGLRSLRRVIGIGGDAVRLSDDHLTINGLPLEYSPPDPELLAYIEPDGDKFIYETESIGRHRHLIQINRRIFNQMMREHRSFGTLSVPQGQLLVLGDNRDNSRDSRYFTSGPFVPVSSVIAKVNYVVMSFDIERFFRPRWSRFFTKLP